MNKDNTATTWVVSIIVLLIIIGGIIIFAKNNKNPGNTVATSTATTTSTSMTSANSHVSGLPIVTAKPSVIPTATGAIIIGTVNPNDGSTDYWYEFGLGSALGTRSAKMTLGSGFTVVPAPIFISGLHANTLYYYRLVASNSYGKTEGTIYSFTTTNDMQNPVGGVPSAKTSLATAITNTSATFNGEVNPDKNSTEYWFEYGKSKNLGTLTPFVLLGDGSQKLSVSIIANDLEPNTTYYFRLDAQNQFGTDNGSILSFTTSGSQNVSKPTVQTLGASAEATTATLNGKITANGAGTSYWFEYGTDSLFGKTLTKMTTEMFDLKYDAVDDAVSADISSLKATTTYYYRLVAKNSAGETKGESMTFKTK